MVSRKRGTQNIWWKRAKYAAGLVGVSALAMAGQKYKNSHLHSQNGGRWYRNDTESEYEGEGEQRRKIHTKSAVRRRRAKNSKKWYKRAAVGALALGVGALAYRNRAAIGDKYNSTLTGINKYADDTATGINKYADDRINAVKTAYGDAATGINKYVDAAKESIGTTAENLGDAMKQGKDYVASRTYKNTVGKAIRRTTQAFTHHGRDTPRTHRENIRGHLKYMADKDDENKPFFDAMAKQKQENEDEANFKDVMENAYKEEDHPTIQQSNNIFS